MSVSRRGFLKGVAAGALVAGTARAGSVKHFAGYPGRYGLLHDTNLCIGCRSCEVACNEVNQLPPPRVPVGDLGIFGKERKIDDKLYTVVNRYREASGSQPAVFRKHQCMHCNEPCCASVCFVEAFVKTPEGPVLYDPELCVGCRYCVFACPYYALAYEYDRAVEPRVVRCTMCYDRILRGLNPKCSDVCPTGAIVFGPRKELLRLARERIRKLPNKYIDFVFGEHEYGGTSWLTIGGMSFGRMGLPEGLPMDPLPNLTTSFLSLAPLVAAIFPGLLAGFYAFSKRRDMISQREKDALLAEARARAAREMEEKLQTAERLAAREKEAAVEAAVREALRRVGSRAGPPATAPDGPAPKKEG